MRVFVAYGYNDRDRWVKEFVIPLIQAFGDEAVTGDQIYEGQIPDAVAERVRSSDALVAILTRRADQAGALTNATHPWVLQEVGHAIFLKRKMVLPVWEDGLDPQSGNTQGLHYLVYREQERGKCLGQIVEALWAWHSKGTVRLQIMPPEQALELRPLLRDRSFRARYRLRINGEDSPLQDTQILRIKGGLFIEIERVPLEALVQVEIDCAGQTWSSDYESMDSVAVNISKE